MIYGIGTDICDIRRIRASLDKHGERFAAKVLSEGEMATWKARSARWPERGIRYLATRFSAKEAFSKAVGLGLNAGHDLNRDNLPAFVKAVPGLQEVSIGHALIGDALELGYAATVQAYLKALA